MMKKNMINKSNVLKVCLLVIFISMLPYANVNAQQSKDTLYYKISGVPIEVGDSVMINRDSLYYRTGERKSTWVYDKIHTVMQVNSKKHPNAILLKEIYSWVEIGSIEPMNKVKREQVYREIETIQQKEKEAKLAEQTVVEQLPAHVVDEPAPVVEEDTTAQQPEEPQPTQFNRLAIGLRAGFASTQFTLAMPVGFDALLDVRYAHYWPVKKLHLGIMTGLSAGYVQAHQRFIPYQDEFVLATDEGNVSYEVTADDIQETTHQIQLEVPVMFSMSTEKGFFLHVGPKLILPVYSQFHQTISNPIIAAYLPELNGNPIINEVVMGKLTEAQTDIKASFNNEWKLSLALAAELGYEFKFQNGHSLDLGVYADWTLYNMYQQYGQGKVIAITPPSVNSAAIVDVQSITQAYASKFTPFDLGIKLAYNINFFKK